MDIAKVFKDAKMELAKVIFPTKGQVKQAYISVVVVVSAIAAFLALVDLVMSSIVSAILG